MEPLRLHLSEDLSLKLESLSQAQKDEIEQMHSQLILEVQHFYNEKRDELESFALKKIYENKNSITNLNTFATKSPPPKSIVKRRPSRSEKRVSFSQSPPKVEHFKIGEEVDKFKMKLSEQCKPVFPKQPLPNDTEEQLFDFEDVVQGDISATNDSVLDHQSRPEHTFDSIQDDFSHLDVSPRQSFHVGSLPLNIKPNMNVVTYDGGPPQKTEFDEKEYEEEMFSPKSFATTDPSKMSFTQRMEWESLSKHKLNEKRAGVKG